MTTPNLDAPTPAPRRASLGIIFLIVFIDLVGFGIFLPNQQYYGQTFGIASTFALVLIGPTYSIFQFLFAPILGRWSDRIGRRPVLIVSQCGTLGGFLMLYASHFLANPTGAGLSGTLAIVLLYLSRVIDGISGGNISTASAYVADITTPENRAKGMGLLGAAFGLGFIFGPFIGGAVGYYAGLPFVPLTAAAFSLVALLLTIFRLPESHHPGEPTPDARRFSVTGLRHALARPVIGAMILMFFANGFAFAGMEQTFSLLLQDRTGLLNARDASRASGFLFGGIGLVIVFVQGGMIRPLTKRYGEAKLVLIGPTFIAFGLLLVGIAGWLIPVWPGLIAGTLLLALGSSLFNPSITSLISRHAGKQEQGEILGTNQGMASLARAVGPLLAGALYALASPAAPYFASAAICFTVTITAILMRERLRPPAAK